MQCEWKKDEKFMNEFVRKI